MRSSTSPAALALLAMPMAVSARPRCQSVYPVTSASVVVPSSHPVGYNVSSHVVPSTSVNASVYPVSSASASASASLSSANYPASYPAVSASASASGSTSHSASSASSASASISSAGYSVSSVSASSASASYSGSASTSASYSGSAPASYSASTSAPYSVSASVSYSASASASNSASYSASFSASNSASASASNSASATASNSASATASNSASASASASSYPIADMGPAFCLINDAVISAMHKAPEATAFCSSYLSIPTQTTTVTATQTPADITVTVPVTITGEDRITAVVTATSTTSTDVTTTLTVTVPSTVTVTSTTSTAVLTCLNSAYTASEPVGTVPSVVDKRTVAVATPTCLPTNWASAAVSRACSCLSVPAATATTTVTQTLAPGTATATTTDVLTPTVTAIETAVQTETSTHTETTTVTDGTVTATAYAEATSIAASGLQYRRWEHPYDANEEAPGYTVNYFKNRTPLGAGTLRTPTFRGNANSLTLPTTPSTGVISGAQAAVLMQGFFVARQTGTYTLWSGANDIDNWGYLWTGVPALADWRDDNTAFKAVRTGRLGRYTGGITYVTLKAGDAVPIAWLWANGGGDAASFLGIRGPDGRTSTDGADFFVQPCDEGVFQ